MGKGVADLVLLPVEQYRRDGRVFRGLRKGTQSFLRAITIETLHTSHRVASYISRTLDDIVTQPGAHASLRGLEYYDEQPTGVIDSLEHAYDALAKEVQVWQFHVFFVAPRRRYQDARFAACFGRLVSGKESRSCRSLSCVMGCFGLNLNLYKYITKTPFVNANTVTGRFCSFRACACGSISQLGSLPPSCCFLHQPVIGCSTDHHRHSLRGSGGGRGTAWAVLRTVRCASASSCGFATGCRRK